jgi:hypothetical protein
MLLIGSKALAHWVPLSRIGKDFDVFISLDELSEWNKLNKHLVVHSHWGHKYSKQLIKMNTGEIIEFEISKPKSSCDLIEKLNISSPVVDFFGLNIKIADIQSLYIIKKSHITKPIKWFKHINDYHVIKNHMIQNNVKLTKLHKTALKKRIIETNERTKVTKPNLNMSNAEFFAKSQHAVNRVYEHDVLHEKTCFYDRPLYERLKIDKTKAKLEKKLFDALSFDDKIKLVQEEAFAIALERQIIPGNTTDPKAAYFYAIERISTTLTAGWFREFALENFKDIINVNFDYVERFENSFK